MNWPRRKLVTILDSGVMAGGVPPEPPGEGPGGVVDGLGVWYRADQGVSPATDGALVTGWQDSGPNDLDLGILAGNQNPTYQVNERNGQPVIRFDGLDDSLYIGSVLGSSLAAASAQTVFVVQKQLSTDGPSSTYSWGGAGNLLVGHLSWNDLNLYYDTGAISARTTAIRPEPWPDTWHIVEMVRDGMSGSITIEGNSLTPVVIPTTAFNPAASAPLRIGAYIGGEYNFEGDIAELIMYNRTLTAIERDTVRNYLKQKWGIAQNKLKLNPSGTGYLLLNPATNDRLALN